MSPTTPRPSGALAAAVATSLLLGACGAPSPDDASAGTTTPGPAPETTAASEPAPTAEPTTAAPAPSSAAPTGTPSAGPTEPAGPAEPVKLVTYTGTAADAAFAFELPATWAVDGEFTDVGGTVAVVGPDGAPVGHLSVLIAWGAECGPDCSTPPVVHLGDVPGSVPLSASGDFVVRSVAMDLTSAPEIRNAYGWPDSVRLVTSLTDAEVPPPTGMLPHVMHGLGSVETGVVAPNGVTYRTVIFSSVHDFATLEEAQAYVASEEHRQVQAMIASFRA
ncbi:hypothetical protein GCM10011374_21880 [Kocuria dechangensis]|uniref:Lipoprotein n=1 Tax=Kocuria dechangensis TaxID=1176249 RepID=A0A917GVS3_9MICC|nr:hypothetical protein [Kocuria dechangensis]GGG58693.1 hypothetical protein GCM10011374_21880 [Kocuria dechangensis]